MTLDEMWTLAAWMPGREVSWIVTGWMIDEGLIEPPEMTADEIEALLRFFECEGDDNGH